MIRTNHKTRFCQTWIELQSRTILRLSNPCMSGQRCGLRYKRTLGSGLRALAAYVCAHAARHKLVDCLKCLSLPYTVQFFFDTAEPSGDIRVHIALWLLVISSGQTQSVRVSPYLVAYTMKRQSGKPGNGVSVNIAEDQHWPHSEHRVWVAKCWNCFCDFASYQQLLV